VLIYSGTSGNALTTLHYLLQIRAASGGTRPHGACARLDHQCLVRGGRATTGGEGHRAALCPRGPLADDTGGGRDVSKLTTQRGGDRTTSSEDKRGHLNTAGVLIQATRLRANGEGGVVWRTLQASAQGEGRCVACLQLVGHLRPQAPQLHGGQGSVVHTHVVHTAAEGVQVAGRRRADEQRGALRGHSPCSRIHNSRRFI
jgi:hypothetical protein